MKKSVVSCLLLGTLLSGLTLSCKQEEERSSLSTMIRFKKEAQGSLFNPEGKLLKTLDLEIASTPYERERGLMDRESMEELQGMLFIFEKASPLSFYMKNTLIPLDIIYLDDTQKIIKIIPNAQPMNETPLPSDQPAKYVLEIKGGLSAQWGLSPGDSLSYTLQ